MRDDPAPNNFLKCYKQKKRKNPKKKRNEHHCEVHDTMATTALTLPQARSIKLCFRFGAPAGPSIQDMVHVINRILQSSLTVCSYSVIADSQCVCYVYIVCVR